MSLYLSHTANTLTPYLSTVLFLHRISVAVCVIVGNRNQWHNDESTDSYTFCWPMDWLPVDHPTVRVLGVNYETALSEWYVNHEAKCPCEKSGTLHNRATDLLHALADAEVGANGRPVIWVCHSMGGLIAKSIMGECGACQRCGHVVV